MELPLLSLEPNTIPDNYLFHKCGLRIRSILEPNIKPKSSAKQGSVLSERDPRCKSGHAQRKNSVDRTLAI